MIEAFIIIVILLMLVVSFAGLWRIEVSSSNFWKREHDREADAKWAALEEVSQLRARLAAIRATMEEGEPS